MAVGQDVAFDGSLSLDPDGDALSETWMAAGGSVSGSSYTAGTEPGIYDVTLVVNDTKVDSVPAETIVVVYDPNGGFVTGGGWIDSPEGAYTPNDLTVFEANFDSGMPPEFSGNTTTEGVQGYAGLGTGSNLFDGDFLRNGSLPDARTTLTLTDLPPHSSVSLGFLLAIIDSWDGPGCGGDTFNVRVDGATIFSWAFTNHTVCGLQGYVPPSGVELARNTHLGFGYGYGIYGPTNPDAVFADSTYDMGLDPAFQNIPHTSSTLTVEWFASGGFQGDDPKVDESWAIDNVAVLVADEDVTGKANFGFVSKYNRGATTPTGQTEFQFKAGGLDFHSSSYDWLVVAGQNQAKYKGVGTINGTGNYGFMLTAVDNGSSGDTFRIKIWDIDNGDTLVYDNKSVESDYSYAGTVIGGGNIKVHTK